MGNLSTHMYHKWEALQVVHQVGKHFRWFTGKHFRWFTKWGSSSRGVPPHLPISSQLS